MSTYDVLKTALKLMTNPKPLGVVTDEFKPESLSSREKSRLHTQLNRSNRWKPSPRRNIVALGIAEKLTGALRTGELCLAVYVKKKLPVNELGSASHVPPRLEFEGLRESLVTDVREIGALRPEALRAKIRPTICGYSIGRNEKGFTGTLGCVVVKRDGDGKWFILSNSHVIAKYGLGQPGDPIYQPGPDDTRGALNMIARLESWQPFKFGEGFDNHIDAALAAPTAQDLLSPTIFDIGQPKGIHFATRGMMIQKSGRTSGHTWGRVEDVDFHTSVQYPRIDGKGNGMVNFSNLVLCSRYSAPGDSGALVLDSDEFAVGLHFLGSASVSVFSQIHYVMDELQIDFLV